MYCCADILIIQHNEIKYKIKKLKLWITTTRLLYLKAHNKFLKKFLLALDSPVSVSLLDIRGSLKWEMQKTPRDCEVFFILILTI